LYSERIARARESGSPIRGPGGAAGPITARDSGDRDSDKDSAYAASQAAMGGQIRTVDEGREGTGTELPSMAVRATARARGHGETRATVDGDADPEDVEVAVTQPRGSRSTRSMV
jgi:starvation-inducible outer membrane lipoprotein